MPLLLRPATIDDLELLRRWHEQPHVPNDDWNWETELRRFPYWREQLIYERLGFRFIEKRRFGEDECFVYRLDRADYTRCARAPRDE